MNQDREPWQGNESIRDEFSVKARLDFLGARCQRLADRVSILERNSVNRKADEDAGRRIVLAAARLLIKHLEAK